MSFRIQLWRAFSTATRRVPEMFVGDAACEFALAGTGALDIMNHERKMDYTGSLAASYPASWNELFRAVAASCRVSI